tara:strand:- start:61 stop:285 length:225 start_codon:yes stop_codon:yes gene_type:complete
MIGPGEYMAMLNVVDAWNEISWADAIPFLLVVIGLYWVKVKIDASAGLGRKKRRELKKVIVEAILETQVKTGKP